MAAGEYVSVSTQRDSEQALIELETRELREDPEGELAELTQIYAAKGLRRELAGRGRPRAHRRTTRSARTPRPSSASTPTT